jgi:two-component system, NtrC family, sensor kinase
MYKNPLIKSSSRLAASLLFLWILLLPAKVFCQAEDLAALKAQVSNATTEMEQFAASRKLANYYRSSGDIDAYGAVSQELLGIAQTLNNDSLLVISYGNLGNYFANKGDFHSTLAYYLKALRLAEKSNDAEKLCKLYNNVADQYRSLKDYPQAIAYLRKAQALLPKAALVTPEMPQYVYINLCESFLGLGNSDSALKYIQLADANLQKHKNDLAYVNALYDFGLVYDQLGELQLAESYFQRSIAVADSTQDLFNFTEATRYYSLFLLKHKRYADVRRYALQSLTAAQNSGNNLAIINAATLLYDTYLQLNRTDSAFHYLVLKDRYRDTVFNEEQLSRVQQITFNEQIRAQEVEAEKVRYQNKIRFYSLLAAILVLLIIGLLLWRNIRYKQKAFRLLELQKEKTNFQKERVEKAYAELKSTQAQLIHREKMASLGELTAGIAHEIQNPLNFINNFSDVSNELAEEAENELQRNDKEKARRLLQDLRQNLQKIHHHGLRADTIIKNMLQHSRTAKSEMQEVDLNALIDEFLRLSFHGMRAKDKTFNAVLETHFDANVASITANPQDLGRVLLNLFTNAFHSVQEKKKKVNGDYQPTVAVCTKYLAPPAGSDEKGLIEIHVKDNGVGISKQNLEKIYQPFFTTKSPGQGTGLGLSLSYDIITKGHKGDLKVDTKEGEFAEFVIQLPS